MAIFYSIECVGEVCGQDIFVFNICGCCLLDKGIVMFFCGVIGVECFCLL